MRWDDVQYFLEVAERGSVGAAARSLQVNHSTVLRHLGGLERDLGCRLFDRLPTGYVLTEEGREFARAVADIPEQLGDARRRVAGIDAELRGHVRVTAPECLGPMLLGPVMREFRIQHPQVTFDLIIDNTPLRLVQREADIALRGAHQPADTLIGRQVGTVRTAAYAARSYVESCERSGLPIESQWVGLDESLAHLDSAQWLNAHVPASDIVLRTNTLSALGDAVASGLGVGWLLSPVAEARPELVRVREARPEFDTPLWVLTHPDLKRVARVVTFTRFLTERVMSLGL